MKPRLQSFLEYKGLRQALRNNPTKAERILWKYIRGSQLGYKFRRQQGIGSYIVDFYCAEIKLIIELDGYVHGEEENKIKDKERQLCLEQQGFVVIRYRNEQIKYELKTVLQDIKNNCNRLNNC